jgi:hypothetical protein
MRNANGPVANSYDDHFDKDLGEDRATDRVVVFTAIREYDPSESENHLLSTGGTAVVANNRW